MLVAVVVTVVVVTAAVVTAFARVDVYSYFSYAHEKYSKNFKSGF